jgi:hypothetical protein
MPGIGLRKISELPGNTLTSVLSDKPPPAA